MTKLTSRTSISLMFIATISASTISCAKENEDKASLKDEKSVAINANEPATIEDPMGHGEEAHKVHCYKCHTDKIYTRDDRVVKSLDALSQQVDRCKDGTGAPWFDEDAAAVVQFLNEKYYRF
jgi:cytochrome c5